MKVVHVPFGDLFQRIMIPFQTGQRTYDVLFCGSLWLGDFSAYLAEVTETCRGIASWDGRMLQYTVDGDRHYLKYRADVFSDPAAQALFKARTGRDLTVPATWQEYNEVAAVFTNTDQDGDGAPTIATAEVTKRDDLMLSASISRVAPCAKHPEVKGGFFFDPATMAPLINTPDWVKGLELLVEAQASMLPGGAACGPGAEVFSFSGDQTLMSYSRDDAFVQAMQEDSPIRNKVFGFSASPDPARASTMASQRSRPMYAAPKSRTPCTCPRWTTAIYPRELAGQTAVCPAVRSS